MPVPFPVAAGAIGVPAVLDGGLLVRVGDVGDDPGDELTGLSMKRRFGILQGLDLSIPGTR